jgi:hypothetical protein
MKVILIRHIQLLLDEFTISYQYHHAILMQDGRTIDHMVTTLGVDGVLKWADTKGFAEATITIEEERIVPTLAI